MKRLAVFAVIVFLLACSFALRILPAWSTVFTSQGVNFPDNDAWFHVRTIHNLLAHFPHRSPFDPYALFPGGQVIPTGPLWDYLVAATAWLLALGSPSPHFIDAVAALLPAILGALFPLPALFLAGCLFDAEAGVFAALWIAVASGGFLNLTRLGLADHHAAEALFAFLTLTLLCIALQREPGRKAISVALFAGCAMGAFLAVRPAGVFVPGILACATVLEPLIAPVALAAVLAASVVFLPVTGALWSDYAWLSLAVAGGAAVGVLVLSRFTRRRRWFLAAAAGAAFVLLGLRLPLLASLWFQVTRVAGIGHGSPIVSTVAELQPVFRFGRGGSLTPVFESLGVVWIIALPVLLWACFRLWRVRQPALLLFTLWSAVMTVGAFIQLRMLIYFVPVAAVMAGVACARLVRAPRRHPALVAAVVVLTIGLNLPFAIREMKPGPSPDADWRAALTWLRTNSPEPFGDAAAWYRYNDKPGPERSNNAMPSGWGVAVWWDHGYVVEELAHRIPMSNGTQAGAEDMARLFTGEIPEASVQWLRRSGARYVIVDAQMPVFAGNTNAYFAAALHVLGRDLGEYVHILRRRNGGKLERLPVYSPEYYATLAARLYLADGAAVKGSGPWLFETDGTGVVLWARHYATREEAEEFIATYPDRRLVMGCLDSGVSCVDLAPVRGLNHVFSSDPLPLSPSRPLRAVKIFEVTGL